MMRDPGKPGRTQGQTERDPHPMGQIEPVRTSMAGSQQRQEDLTYAEFFADCSQATRELFVAMLTEAKQRGYKTKPLDDSYAIGAKLIGDPKKRRIVKFAYCKKKGQNLAVWLSRLNLEKPEEDKRREHLLRQAVFKVAKYSRLQNSLVTDEITDTNAEGIRAAFKVLLESVDHLFVHGPHVQKR